MSLAIRPRLLAALWVATAPALVAGCTVGALSCAKDFECQEALQLSLDDDYVPVCEAGQRGRQSVLRASAELECGRLADAEALLDGCIATLDCAGYASLRAGAEGTCTQLSDDAAAALVASGDGIKCDGIEDGSQTDVEPAGEGEGE